MNFPMAKGVFVLKDTLCHLRISSLFNYKSDKNLFIFGKICVIIGEINLHYLFTIACTMTGFL